MCVVISVIPLLCVLVYAHLPDPPFSFSPHWMCMLGGSGDEISRELYLGGGVACFSQL